jgi:hypothetical protein
MGETLSTYWQPIMPAVSLPILISEQEEEEEFGKYCHMCDELIPMVEQAVEVTVVHGFKNGNNMQCYPVFDDEGDFKYTPLHFHEECWEELMDAVRRMNQDEPSVILREEAIKCSICDSSITEGEEFSAAEPGEFHVSPRSPDDKVELDFHKYECPRPVCFGCMAKVDQLLEDGDDDEEDDE